MNKEELVKEISKKAKVSQKAAADVLAAMLDTVEKTVSKGKKVTLVGFGTFEARKRSARTGRNPQTGAAIKIAAKTVPAFSAGKKFKELVNKG
ncbi:MAG: HU family DNA-binding protein [Candidatus Gastranaerophilales bacterium]|nr:HU family DNA-binding protein [Candidatus Gastranaerophilales bacterium]